MANRDMIRPGAAGADAIQADITHRQSDGRI